MAVESALAIIGFVRDPGTSVVSPEGRAGDGVGGEVERLAGEAGVLIMKAVIDAEVASLAGPKGKHDPRRKAARWTGQQGYVVLSSMSEGP